MLVCSYARRNRKEMELKTAVMLHNIFLIALSLYMGVEIGRQAWINNYKFVCNRVDRSPSGLAVERAARVLWRKFTQPAAETGGVFFVVFVALLAKMARVLYIFYLSKAYEMLDTVLLMFVFCFASVCFCCCFIVLFCFVLLLKL